MAVTGKKIFAKVYDYAGAFIATIDPINLTSDIVESINQGYGTAGFTFPAVLGNYGEGAAIWYNNEVRLVVVDVDSGPDGTVVFTGTVSDYKETSEGGKDQVEVTLEAYTFQLANTPLKNGDNLLFKTRASGTALDETLADAEAREVSDVLKKAIDYYQGENVAPKLTYTASSIANTGSTMTYTFVAERVSRVVQECLEWAPANWFFRISPTGVIFFQPKPSSATHLLVLNKHFTRWSAEKVLTDVLNYIPFTNGSAEPRITKIYKDTNSILQHGQRSPQDFWITDERVTSLAFADQKMNALLEERKNPIIKAKLTLLDNNYADDGFGVDIESIAVGDTVRIEGLDELNSNALSNNMTIVSVRKNLDYCEIELEGVRINSQQKLAENTQKVAVIQAKGALPRVITGTEQAFDLTLQNNWVNYDVTNWSKAQFWKDGEGRVYIWGTIKSGTATNGTVLATLPPGFRPTGTEVFQTHGWNGTTHTAVRIDVQTNGSIVLVATIPTSGIAVNNGYLTLSGIGFYTAENTLHKSFGFVNNWRAYVDDFPGDNYPRPQFFVSPKTGVVYTRGLANGGTVNAIMGYIPDDLKPRNNALFTTVGDQNQRRLDFYGDETSGDKGAVRPLNYSISAWASLSGVGFLSKTGNKYQLPTLLNGFSTYAATAAAPTPWGRPGYYVDEMGFCHLEGMSTGGSQGAIIFTLPVGARPKKRHRFTIIRADGAYLGAIEVWEDGGVRMSIMSAIVGEWTSLWGVVFPVF